MVKTLVKRMLPVLLAIMLVVTMIPTGILTASANSDTVLDGKVSIADTLNNLSVSGNTATATAAGGYTTLTRKTNTITIKNETTETATISFDYAVSNSPNSFSLDGNSSAATSGSYSKLLEGGASFTISFQGKKATSSNTATLTISNIAYAIASTSSNVTFTYDNNFGSVTVGGEAITSGTVKEIGLEGATIAATALSGAAFKGWIDAATGAVISTDATYTYTPTSDITVKAVFIGANSDPYFMIGTTTQHKEEQKLVITVETRYYYTVNPTYIFDNLNSAINASVASENSKTIVLMNSGTLPTGDYTIPAGITLLIPFNASNTLFTDTPLNHASTARVEPSPYRTLTLTSGTNITVNGAISLSSYHNAANGAGQGCNTSGPYGHISMAEGSNITVNNGGKLYTWGYITGNGSVEAKDGATIYEYFQCRDFRGGSQTSDMDNGVFPFSQYYVQNIEVPLTLNAGSTEKSYTTIAMGGINFGEDLAFIGEDDAMFSLVSGKVVKRYDGSTDRLIIEADGEMSIAPIEITLGIPGLGSSLGATINTKDYELPINSNITIIINSGRIDVKQDAALLPGAQFIIREDAECYLGQGNSIYVYDADDWGNFSFGYKSVNAKFWPVLYAPGRTYDRTEEDIVDAMIQVDGYGDASKGCIYTTDGGANIFSTGTGKVVTAVGTQTVTYQLVQGTGYTEIPITTLKLKNEDGTYVNAANDTYTYVVDKWVCTNHNYEDVVTEPTCNSQGFTTHTCTACGESYQDTVVPPTTHSYEAVVTAPTCDSQGFTTYTCSICGDTYVGDYVAALDHAYSAVVTEPTCTEKGYTTYTCSVCGDSYVDNYVDALQHNYNTVVTEPTCTEKGYTTYTCSVCGDTYIDNYTDVIDHTYGDWIVDVEPTCETAGQRHRVCSCSDVETEVIDALGHSYNSVVTAPTCTEKGYTTYTCSVCGDTYVEDYVDALGHAYSTVITEPTCIEKGFTTYTCSVCGDSYVDNYVEALGHSYGDWIVSVEPTCEADGEKYKVCSCSDKITEVIKATGHSYSDEYTIDVPATDLNEGSKSYHCANCDSTIGAATIPALTDFIATVTDGTVTITGYKGEVSGRFTIPETLDGYKVVAIADDAFKDSLALGIVEIPVSVVNISATAFAGCENLIAINYYGTIADWKLIQLGDNAIADGVRINYLGENIGDLNDDGNVNADDMTYLVTYVLKGGELSEVQSYLYDTNADDTVNLLDLVRLKKYLAGDYTYLGHVTVLGVEEQMSLFLASPSGEAIAATLSTNTLEPEINDYETFVGYLAVLEELAYAYIFEVDASADPIDLVIKYIRTGVDRYNSGSWGIMAGYENKGFANFVKEIDDMSNEGVDPSECMYISSLKNINNFYLPNGDYVDFGHMFGTMDMTYHNKGSINHADVGGWAGDLVDLLTAADEGGVTGTIEEMVADIGANYLNKEVGENGKFSQTDMYGDLDGMYLMNELDAENYEFGDILNLVLEYFTEDLSMVDRAEYFIDNRMDGVSLRSTLRNEVYNTYIGNMVITTLESTREFTSNNIADLRKACCYAFADYICKLAGDYVDSVDNKYFEPFSTTTSTLAPGVTQEIKYATTADDKQMVYYIATADLNRDDVNLYANYHDNDPAAGWEMQTVLDQANAAQNKYGNPESEHYIENYNVIVSTNGSGFNMATGEPSGVLVMGGVEYHPIDANGFVGVLKDGTPVIGTRDEYNTIYKGQVQEAIQIFGATLVKDGKLAVAETANHTSGRASRTAIGITRTGKIVMMVLDGRQEPVSCGGSMLEIAQIMLDAGCVHAVNLDGGGSTTFVSKAEGADELAVVNRPSDGYARSVSTSFMIVSTAPSSTAFDHAVINSDYNYLTVGSSINMTASGVSATGNAAELPEGTSWAVSNTGVAVIDDNGVLTARTNGQVNVYLMLGEEAIAVKTIEVVVPDNIYFTKDSQNAVYESRVELPIKLSYLAKPVKYNVNDVTLSMNNSKAGIFEGLFFIGKESGNVKNVTITAALKTNPEASDTMTIALFSQGEAVFDFDQATGGDKEMAWDRVVSNSTTDDSLNYYVQDADKDMTTSYTFAIDMSKIGIPEQLSGLTYMLPGAESGEASAWGFLCQLAERISVLTEVKATINFDPNVVVDYSKLTIVNDYFVHTATEFDEDTNTITLVLKWIDQTEPIDSTMANPICIVSGIKLTPKADIDWGTDGKYQIVNGGNISYDMYLRANALYTFAQKEENQQQFGLYPFINPDDETEKGGHYSSVYKIFEDKYNLIKARKNGWANEDGGFVYYVEGERITGISLVDGYYYDFGENGVNVGKTTYTGLFFDKTVSKYRYAKLGELQSGWQMIGEDWYHFRSDKTATTGKAVVGGVHYEFYETGKLVSGVWVSTLQGKRYYYGPYYYTTRWQTIDGESYYFRDGYPVTGYSIVASMNNVVDRRWHYFDENGVFQGLANGIIESDGNYYYVENGLGKEKYLIEYEGNYYFAQYGGKLITNQTYFAWATNCDLSRGTYIFGEDGKMLGTNPNGEILEFDGKLYYYEKGQGVEKGLFKFNGEYYFAKYGGKLVTNQVCGTYSFSDCDLPNGTYEFGPDGKMVQGIVEKDGKLYYYENGKGVEKGLFKFNGDYYFAKYKGLLVTNQVCGTYSFSNCDLPNGTYEFGPDGKMLQGIVDKDGVLYYYENGKGVEKGLFKYNGDYYFSRYKGKLVTNEVCGTYSFVGCDLPNGTYEFGPDGKMVQGIVEKDGKLYYYENGKGVEKGLFKFNGDYYFAKYKGLLVTNQVCGTYSFSNCDLPNGMYEFGPDGKMLQGIVEKDGKLYYYENGKRVEKGLFKYNDDYYFVKYRGEIVTNQVCGTYSFSDCDLPNGTYEFGPDGKMLQGIVEKDGKLYYYENGKGVEKGLFKLGDDYYFARYKGEIVTNQVCGTYSYSDCDLPNGRYEFGADGKMVQGIVEKGGKLYYYENGKGVEKGLFYYEGHYYFAEYNGRLVVDTQYYVWNTNGLLLGTTYTFNELGQIVG